MPGLPVKVLMTGATGFIGQYVTQWFLSSGYEVSAIVLPGEQPLLPPGVESISGDIVDTAGVAASVRAIAPDLIIHLAAAGVTNPGMSFQESCNVNVQGVINLLEAARTTSTVQRLVLFGSSHEYGARRSDDDLDPFNAYGASKLAAWAYTRAAYNAWGLPVVWVATLSSIRSRTARKDFHSFSNPCCFIWARLSDDCWCPAARLYLY
jgi:GDP-4-dehydro-6-deoxy-D-mannose reductase